MSKLAKNKPSSLIVCLSCLFLVVVAANGTGAFRFTDISNPTTVLAMPRNTLELGRRTLHLPGIGLVHSGTAKPEVFPAVVQPITVDVINLVRLGLEFKYESVHVHVSPACPPSQLVSRGIMAPLVLQGMPPELRNPLEVFVAYKCLEPAAKLYSLHVRNHKVGRLGRQA